MVEIKVNVGDPKTKKTYTFQISAEDAPQVFGVKIGDKIRGELIEKPGYEFEVTGGSDKAGFPMRADVEGVGRRKLLITKGTGNQKKRKGMRIRKTVSANTVSDITAQLNVKVVKEGKAPLVEEEKPVEPAETDAEQKEETPEKVKEKSSE